MAGLFIIGASQSSTDTVLWSWILPTTVDMCIIYTSTIWVLKQNDISIKQARSISIARQQAEKESSSSDRENSSNSPTSPSNSELNNKVTISSNPSSPRFGNNNSCITKKNK